MYLKQIEKTDFVMQFQERDCEFLACALHEAFGYPAMVLLETYNTPSDPGFLEMSFDTHRDYFYSHDSYNSETNIMHCFSYFQQNGKTYYADSFGITDDIRDILCHFRLSLDDIDGERLQLVKFTDPHNIRTRFWSTYYDWADDETDPATLEQLTEEHRIQSTKAFVAQFRDRLTLSSKTQKLNTLLSAAEEQLLHRVHPLDLPKNSDERAEHLGGRVL